MSLAVSSLSGVNENTMSIVTDSEVDETTRWRECVNSNQSIYDFQIETLQGDYTDLSQYRGKVILLVNVATFCGTYNF